MANTQNTSNSSSIDRSTEFLEHTKVQASVYMSKKDAQREAGYDSTGIDRLTNEVQSRLKTYNGDKKGILAVVDMVDAVVNENVKYKDERLDTFETGAVTANLKTGDCDKFAVLKAEMLIRLGVPADRVSVLTLAPRDPNDPNKAGHAVCTYTDEKGQVYVLNNEGGG